VNLSNEDEIQVPEDAWADWDAANQKWITVGEKFPDGVTSKTKTTIYYPDDFFSKETWHDGSQMTVGDFVMGMIITFDLGKEDSPYYDPAATPALDSFLSHFKGVQIESTDPLVISTYDDSFALDAENTAVAWTWFPRFTFGTAPWHTLALGLIAEGNGESAFSPDKAAEAEIEQTSFLTGPTIEILANDLTGVTDPTALPYMATLSQYITPEEAATRFANLNAWYQKYGHFWIGTGPYFVESVFPVEKTITLARNENYQWPATRFIEYTTAPLPDVVLDGPSSVTIGDTASYTALVTINDEAYPAEDIKSVLYLVYDAEGNLVMQGEGTGGDDGVWDIEYDTSDLAEGSNRVEVVVVSNKVGVPVFASQDFVTTQ